MIVEATYIGPFFKVLVPGYAHRECKRGETVKLRVPEGVALGGCWEIVKGKTAYEKGLKNAEKKRTDNLKAYKEKKQRADEKAAKARDKIVEAADKTTKPGKKG